MKPVMRFLPLLVVTFLRASLVHAQGNCTTDCGSLDYNLTSSVFDVGGTVVVPDGSFVQLWSIDSSDQIIELLDDTHAIGDGTLSSGTGRLEVSGIPVTPGPYRLRLRVYNTASPVAGDPSTCAFVSAVVAVTVPGSPPGSVTADFGGGTIPSGNYAAGEGGCSAPSAVQLQSFSAASTSIATEPVVLLMTLMVLILSGGWAVGWVVLPRMWKARLNLNGRE